MRSIEIQGHRGARGLAPENSLPGFARALEIGVDAIELDVAVCADGAVVVAHDRGLNALIARDSSGAPIPEPPPVIHQLSLTRLRRYEIGRLRPGSVYARLFPEQQQLDGVHIPTLEQVVDLTRRAANHEVVFNIEIKSSPEHPEDTLPPREFAEAVVADVARLDIETRTRIQSFDWRVLQHVQRLAQRIPCGYLSAQQSWFDTIRISDPAPSPWTAGFRPRAHGSLARAVKAAGGAIWAPYFEELSHPGVAAAQELGLKVVPWTVNGPADMRRLARLGVDGIISDFPDRLRAQLEGLGLPLPAPTPVEA